MLFNNIQYLFRKHSIPKKSHLEQKSRRTIIKYELEIHTIWPNWNLHDSLNFQACNKVMSNKNLF